MEVATVESKLYIVLEQPMLCMFIPLVELLGLVKQAMLTTIGVGMFVVDRPVVGEWFLGIDIAMFPYYTTIHSVQTKEMVVLHVIMDICWLGDFHCRFHTIPYLFLGTTVDFLVPLVALVGLIIQTTLWLVSPHLYSWSVEHLPSFSYRRLRILRLIERWHW